MMRPSRHSEKLQHQIWDEWRSWHGGGRALNRHSMASGVTLIMKKAPQLDCRHAPRLAVLVELFVEYFFCDLVIPASLIPLPSNIGPVLSVVHC